MISFKSASVGIINRCCFVEDTGHALYGSGVASDWFIPCVSINLTICKSCPCSTSPYIGGNEVFSFILNNHSHLSSSITGRSCYCHEVTPPDRDDINCFFYGASCSGTYPVLFNSGVSNNVISNYNFINNSDSSGYFALNRDVKTVIKNSLIWFTSTSATLNLLYSSKSGATVSIKGTFLVASGTISNDSKVTLTDGTTSTKSASTHREFPNHPEHPLCNRVSLRFSQSTIFHRMHKLIFIFCILL